MQGQNLLIWKNLKKIGAPNFKEIQSLAFQTYKSKHKLDEELFRAYLVLKVKPINVDTR